VVLNRDRERPSVELAFGCFHDDAIINGEYRSAKWCNEIAACVLSLSMIAIRSETTTTGLVALGWNKR
jgi:hypothetical protein